MTSQPITHTTRPIVTGTSVISIRTDRFIMMAADTLGSYGSLARFHDIQRIRSVGNQSLLGAGGEISDFQQIMEYLSELEEDSLCYDDNVRLEAKEIHSYLTRICYRRRSKVDPFYNQFAIGGYLAATKSFYLGYTDLFGTTFTDNYVCTGFGAHFAYPLLRKGYAELETEDRKMSIDEARQLLADTMRVLFYRDCRTINKIVFAVIDENGVTIDKPVAIQTNWDLSEINPVKELQDTSRLIVDEDNEEAMDDAKVDT